MSPAPVGTEKDYYFQETSLSLSYLVRGEWDERDNADPGHSWLSCFFHAFCCCSKPEYLQMMHFKRHMLLKHFV